MILFLNINAKKWHEVIKIKLERGSFSLLLDFRCYNFKSFQDGFGLIMTPYPRLKEMNDTLLREKIGNKYEKTLSVSAIYGANASGKTSVINAMSCMREIVLRGNISDAIDNRSGDYVSANMTLIPFRFAIGKKPVQFSVTFTYKNKKYNYLLSFMVGGFGETSHERYIDFEALYVNDQIIFERDKEKILTLSLKSIKKFLNLGGTPENAQAIMSKNVASLSLILTSDFYSFCSKQIVDEIKDWFLTKFIIANTANRGGFYPIISDSLNKSSVLIISDMINKIAEEAGIIGSELAYMSDMERNDVQLVSVLKNGGGKNKAINAEIIESWGTIRLLAIMPGIIYALRNGAVLAVDELDSSLHPMIIMNLISLFHNNKVNKNRAQLIFNTHNPIYIWKQRGMDNKNLLRRDEICFVERDKATKSSCLYALSDLKANGKTSVRKTSDYVKNYFANRYGAIENIDFTDIVLKVLENGDSEHVRRYQKTE